MTRGKKTKKESTSEERLAEALVPVEEQPYPVPENWCWVILGNLVKIYRGASPRPIKAFITDDETGINWIKIGDADCGKYIVRTKEKISEAGVKKSVFVNKGTLLLSNSMSFGRPYILNIDGCIHDGWLAITPSNSFSKEYLYYALMASEWYFQQVAVGTAVRNLNSERVAKTPVPLPPKAEQQRIVDCIESLFAKLDEAKEEAQAVVDGFETRKVMILHKAFVGELTVQWRSNNNISTDTWLQKKLSECTYAIGDGLHGTPLFSENEDYYFINGNNFSGEMIEIKQDTKSVDIHEFEKYRVPLFPDLTVFVSINGTLGKTAFYNGESIILGKSACYINVSEELNKYYLRYYLWSKDFVDYANRMATGSTIKNLGLKAMRNLLIPLPSLDEQAEIVRILDDLLNKEQQAKASAETVLDQIDTMKKAILARAFRGKLGTNDPTEESSIELLKENVRSYFNE